MTKKNYTRREVLKAGVVVGTTFAVAPLVMRTEVLAANKKNPRLYVGYIFTTHHTPLMVAAIRGKAFKKAGAYLRTMVPKQKYELVSADGSSLAVLNLIVSKSGSETTTLFAQNRLDIGLASSTAFMCGIDRGTKMKILCPLHVDGMAMVFPPDSTLNGWADVERYIRNSKSPVKIGYHSPTSAPRVVFEGALHKAGFKITENANDVSADILLVDLRSTSNLMPALVSRQVDCWVGPAPYPAVAEFKNVGHMALDSRALPPKGEWENFPCCVMGASEQAIAKHPKVIQCMTDLITVVGDWCNANKTETASISSQWIGVPAQAVERSKIVYTTMPSQNWMRGVGMFVSVLNSMKKFRGSLNGQKLADVQDLLFDFSFVNRSQSKG